MTAGKRKETEAMRLHNSFPLRSFAEKKPMIWSDSCRGNTDRKSYFLKVASVAAHLRPDGSESGAEGEREDEREGGDGTSVCGRTKQFSAVSIAQGNKKQDHRLRERL